MKHILLPYGRARPWLLLGLYALVLWGCSDRQRRNPFDPQAEDPRDNFSVLEAVAGDQVVELRWDFSTFDDIEGVFIYRQTGSEAYVRLPVGQLRPTLQTYTDSSVENGTTYAYRLALAVVGEAEVLLEDQTRSVIPGPEIGWIGDFTTGLVWQISADGRGGRFAQGRFPGLQDIAVNRRDGSCWVSDRLFSGLFRILVDGTLETYTASIGETGNMSLDLTEDIGWIIDTAEHTVYWFQTAAPTDTLTFVGVDARFTEPSGIAAQAGRCWIADRQDGRVLLYEPEGKHLVEFKGLLKPGPVAAGPLGVAWVLLNQGNSLSRLGLDGTQLEIKLPFEGAMRLEVDLETGNCWIIGTADLAVFNDGGSLILHIQDVPGGQDIAVDEQTRHIWLSTNNALWKMDMMGQTLSRLEGFTTAARVVVDPGTP